MDAVLHEYKMLDRGSVFRCQSCLCPGVHPGVGCGGHDAQARTMCTRFGLTEVTGPRQAMCSGGVLQQGWRRWRRGRCPQHEETLAAAADRHARAHAA